MSVIYIKAITNWLSDFESFQYFLHFSENGAGKWKNLQLTCDDKLADYFFIINYPITNVPDLKRTIVFHMEPRAGVATWGDWAAPPRELFLQVRSHDLYQNNAEWWISEPFFRMGRVSGKKHCLSAVVSSKYTDPGHVKRLNFLRFLSDKDPTFVDVFGTCSDLKIDNYKGELPDRDKTGALYPYNYHFAAENHSELNYITEKLYDAIVAECLCFYWGASNVQDIFGEAVIVLPLEDFEKDYQLMKTCIENNEREKRLPYIREAKQRILTQYQIYPTLHSVISATRHCRNIYCLNLERRGDRRAAMVLKLAAAGIDHYSFYRAIDGRDDENFTSDVIRLFKGNDFGYQRGVMACALGHYAMWRELVADEKAAEDDYVFVLEDDVKFAPEFQRYFCQLVTSLYEKDPYWDVFFPSYLMTPENLEIYRDKYQKTCPTQEPMLAPLDLSLYMGGTHLYLITKSGARKLCDFIAAKGIQHGIDYIWKCYAGELKLRLYESQYQLAEAPWVMSEQGDTDIQIVNDGLGDKKVIKALYSWEQLTSLLNL